MNKTIGLLIENFMSIEKKSCFRSRIKPNECGF